MDGAVGMLEVLLLDGPDKEAMKEGSSVARGFVLNAYKMQRC